jgi:hypothetical protein
MIRGERTLDLAKRFGVSSERTSQKRRTFFTTGNGSTAKMPRRHDNSPTERRATDMNISIPAEAHSDDFVYKIEFDAEAWFAQAEDADILALAESGWGGDYAADTVVQWFEDRDDDVAAMFDYLARKDECGYECHVDDEAALLWLKSHRPSLAKSLV